MRARRVSLGELADDPTGSLCARTYLIYRTRTPVEYRGETRTLGEWADALNQSLTLLRNRLNRGWSVERALASGPLPRGQWDANNRKRSRQVTLDGVTRRICDWLKIKGLKQSTFYMRIARGESDTEALSHPTGVRLPKVRQCGRCGRREHNRRSCRTSIYAIAMSLRT